MKRITMVTSHTEPKPPVEQGVSDDKRALMDNWKGVTAMIYKMHYKSADKARRIHYALNSVVIVLTTLTGSTLLIKYVTDVTGYEAVPLILAFAATLMSTVQTFLNFGGRAEAHKETGARFAALNKEINHIIAFADEMDSADLDRRLTEFRKNWDALSLEAPTVFQSVLPESQNHSRN